MILFDYFAKLCYGLPHCGCSLCYRTPLKRLSEHNFISINHVGQEDLETTRDIDTVTIKEEKVRCS